MSRSTLPILAVAASLLAAPRLGGADEPAAGDDLTLLAAGEYTHERGFRMLRRGAWRAAARQFRAALQNQPGAAGPWAGLALAECRLGELEQARRDADHSASLDPDQPLLHTAHACLLEAEGDVNGTVEMLQAASDSSLMPVYPTQWAWFLIRQGLYADAELVVDRMAAAGHQGQTVEAMRVRCRLAAGDLETSSMSVEEVRIVARTARSGLALELLHALAADTLTREVTTSYPFLVPRSGGVDEIVLLKAEAQRRIGLLDEAEAEAARRKRDPDDPVGWAVLVRLACDLGHLDEAEQLLGEAQRSAPLDPSLLLSEAYLRLAQGDRASAEFALELARSAGVPAWDDVVEQDIVARL